MPNRIYQLRKALRLSQTAFGEKIGVTGGAVSQIERGLREPSKPLLSMICGTFGISMDWLLTGEGPMESAAGAQLVTEDMVDTVNRLLQVATHLSDADWAAVKEAIACLVAAAEAGRMSPMPD